MPYSIGQVTEDGDNLQLTMQNHRAEMIAKGFKEARFQSFDDSLNAVVRKNSTQKAAHSTLLQSTSDQNDAIDEGVKMVTKIQDAAKSAFGKNRTKLNEFKIGAKKPYVVSRLAALLDYLAGVCTKYHDELIENGLTEDDFTAITAAYTNLVSTDAVQEHSKKLRNVATETRDDAVAALQEEMFKVRSFAKAAFAGNKAVLEEFKPIKKGKGRAAAKPPVPVPEPQAATQPK
ncbi:MAG TPA: hypothetical protein VLX91_03840 [Candidatus Acidoferrales bacterium]|nr:hypothetical protein [Candidatus Acidoferrales bacterium]